MIEVKRPLAIVSFSILAAFYAVITMPRRAFCISLSLFALYAFIHLFTGRKYAKEIFLSLVCTVLAAVIFPLYAHRLQNRISHLRQKDDFSLTATVKSVGDVGESGYYIVRGERIDGRNVRDFCVRLYTDDVLVPGEKVVLQGSFSPFSPKYNSTYSYSKNIIGYFDAERIYKADSGVGFDYLFSLIKGKLTDSAKKLYSPNSLPYVMAMGLGDKTLLSRQASESFNYTGISHALVVSGLHVGFVLAAVSAALSYIPISKKAKNLLSVALIIIFMGIIGFTPSVIRAGCLSCCILLGRNFILEIDNYTVLAIIILITLAINPYSAADPSLLLSYCAYFGVVAAMDISARREYTAVQSSLLATCFAVLFTAPVMSVLGMDTTLLSPLFNLVLSPVIMVVCLSSFLSCIFAFVPVLGPAVNFLLVPLNKMFIGILSLVAELSRDNLGFAMVNLGHSAVGFMIFAALIGTVIAFMQFDSGKLRKIFILAVSLTSLLCYNLLNGSFVSIKVFDSGKSVSFYITDGNKNAFVFSEDISRQTLEYFMERENITRADLAVYCTENAANLPDKGDLFDDVNYIHKSGRYNMGFLTLDVLGEKDKSRYIIGVKGVEFCFCGEKGLADKHCDFYFFGNDSPQRVWADNSFYFYPLKKRHKGLASKAKSRPLYGTLTVLVDKNSGNYNIVEDVINYGGGIYDF